MFKDGNSFKKIYIACGYTDLRYGVDGLACTIQEVFKLDPYDEGTLFLFCGRRTDRLKGLLWDGDGFLLLYKRLANGRFQWPRSSSELKAVFLENGLIRSHLRLAFRQDCLYSATACAALQRLENCLIIRDKKAGARLHNH